MLDIKKRLRSKKRIAFPEIDDRVLKAALKLKREGKIVPVIVSEKKLSKKYSKLENIVVHKNENLIKLLVKIRKNKGMTAEKAAVLILEPIYYATLLLYRGDVDGIVSGAAHSTAHTLRPALQIIKTKKKGFIASTSFLMLKKGKEPMLFSDCGMNIKPTSKELAQIAISTVDTAKFFGVKPKVAFLSFSTMGSASHDEVDRVKKAVSIAKKNLKVPVDGEMQFDAAFVPNVGKFKAPKSNVAGKANIFIFPDLNSGNIGYKIAQRLGGYEAIGPIVQGLKKPVNDLSRGCSVKEIVDLAYITALQSECS